MIREDCTAQAEIVGERISEAIQCLREGNHLGGLGALAGVDGKLIDLTVLLKLLARTPTGVSLGSRGTPKRRSRKGGNAA